MTQAGRGCTAVAGWVVAGSCSCLWDHPQKPASGEKTQCQETSWALEGCEVKGALRRPEVARTWGLIWARNGGVRVGSEMERRHQALTGGTQAGRLWSLGAGEQEGTRETQTSKPGQVSSKPICRAASQQGCPPT